MNRFEICCDPWSPPVCRALNFLAGEARLTTSVCLGDGRDKWMEISGRSAAIYTWLIVLTR